MVLELVVEKVLMEEIVLSSLIVLRRVIVPSILVPSILSFLWFLYVDRFLVCKSERPLWVSVDRGRKP